MPLAVLGTPCLEHRTGQDVAQDIGGEEELFDFEPALALLIVLHRVEESPQ